MSAMISDMTAVEKKVNLTNHTQIIKMKVVELTRVLELSTPMAKQLQLYKELEKLQKQLDKVQAGMQELVL